MFSIRLKGLRENAGLSQKLFAEQMGISPSTVGMWESGRREPNFATTSKLANFFNVTTDYLLGISAYPNYEKSVETATSPTESDMLKSYRKLDEGDKGEIRGIIKQMLRAPKYDFIKEATG